MRIIPLESNSELYLAPGLVWREQRGDIGLDEARADIWCGQGLATQVLICLMTDRAVDPSLLADGESNRGWPGDSFDLEAGEEPLGSTLWTFRRRALEPGIENEIELAIRQALQTLIDQGAVARIDVLIDVDRSQSRVDYEVSLYGREGHQIYHSKFTDLWRQLDGVDAPLAR